MSRVSCMPFAIMLLAGTLLAPIGVRAQDNNSQSAPAAKKQDSKNNKKKDVTTADNPANLKKLQKELDTPYKKWLEEEVPYIISDVERTAFLHLQTNEEREQFIEAFWQRRDPTPDTVENEFKEEHYRRIAYANEQFSAGAPGWRTDRGRVYITWGPPDEIDDHPTGGPVAKPLGEGTNANGTLDTAYPFVDWTYRHLEGIGDNVIIEFVDPGGTGEYHITMDPDEKIAISAVWNAVRSYNNPDPNQQQGNGYPTPDSQLGSDSQNGMVATNIFSRMDQLSKVLAPPPTKFPDLEEIVTSRVLRNQLTFDHRFDFMRITGDTVLVPVTIEIHNKELTFKGHEGVHSATLDIYARISTLSGRVVQTFDDTVQKDFPDSLLEASLKTDSIYQKAVPLRPGLYKLDLVIKDVNSGDVGVLDERLAVPEIPNDKLDASSLILADQEEPVSARDIGIGQFVLGATKVRPKLDSEFHTDQLVGIYLQIYNLSMDEKTHKNNVSVDLKISRGTQTLVHEIETGAQLKQNGEQLTIGKTFLPKVLPPGKYRLDIQTTDHVTNQSVSRSADFTLIAPLTVAEGAQAKHQ